MWVYLFLFLWKIEWVVPYLSRKFLLLLYYGKKNKAGNIAKRFLYFITDDTYLTIGILLQAHFRVND